MKIPFFNYPQLFLQHQKNLVKIFNDVGSRGAFILQKDLQEFEQSLAKYVGSKYAVGVGNATDGLEMSLKVGGIKNNDEVIISSHTMIATASAIVLSGGKPIPVEVGEDLLIDSKSIESAINENTKAIMPTHLNGRTCNMDIIQNIADRHKLLLFEDAAQGLGSTFKGKGAGTFGLSSVISFYPAKNLGSMGDGGAVLTNDENIYKELILLRDHGRDPATGDVVSWGRNSRLDNLQAAILNYFFKEYKSTIERRRQIAFMYNEELSSIYDIILPPPPDEGDHFDVYQNYEIRAKDRDQLKEYLFQNGVGTLVQWSGKAIHQFKNLGFVDDLPFTDKVFTEILMLPLNMFVTDKEIKYICNHINKFYERK